MPFNAILTPDDLKRGELAEVGWHPVEIIRYHEEEADTDKSCNCIFTFKILDGPSKGIQPRRLFNEKALGFGKNMWASLGVPKDETGNYRLSTQLFESLVGGKLKVYIKRGVSNKGNAYNDVADFQPLS